MLRRFRDRACSAPRACDACHRLRDVRRTFGATVLAALVALVIGANDHAQERIVVDLPFVRLAETTDGVAATLSYDVGVYATLDGAHRVGARVALNGFALPGGDEVSLLLEPVRVMPIGGHAIVVEPDGTESEIEPTMRLFRGVVEGRTGRAFLGSEPGGMYGRIEVDGAIYTVSAGTGTGAGHALVVQRSAHAETRSNRLAGACQTLGDSAHEAPRLAPEAQRVSSAPEVRVADVFLELDPRFRSNFSTNAEAINYALLLTGATSEIYRRDLGLMLRVPSGYVRLWRSRPPWGYSGLQVMPFRDWWVSAANTKGTLPRAGVMLLTDSGRAGVGQAYRIDSACDASEGYAFGSYRGAFPYPTEHVSAGNADLLVFAHELGHIFGSPHTLGYNPPIQCDDGSGPDRGTIMSYCSILKSRRVEFERVGTRFHEQVQDRMRPRIRRSGCVEVIPIRPGDYNANGRLDAVDLAEFQNYEDQGFTSRGSQETFDMNADGVVDADDRQLLSAGAHVPEAFASRRFSTNPRARNCDCLFSSTRPVLGRTWEAHVRTESHASTVLIGSNRAIERGLVTDRGDLLIALATHGATRLFFSVAASNGRGADHAILLPRDAALVGVTIFTQAAILEPNGTRLSNAVDLLLSLN